MSIIDELSRLRQLRESCALTDLEFEHAKAIALQEDAPTSSDPMLHVAVVELEHNLLKIEQDWDRERETFLVGRRRMEPTQSNAQEMILLAVFCLLMWFFAYYFMPGEKDSFLFGAVLGGISHFMFFSSYGIYLFVKSRYFEKAKERYENQKEEIQSQLNSAKFNLHRVR